MIIKNFNRGLFGCNSLRYFNTSLLVMCHAELHRGLRVTAAHNVTGVI